MEKESQMQEMINGIKKTITNSSKFDSNYLVVKDLQGTHNGSTSKRNSEVDVKIIISASLKDCVTAVQLLVSGAHYAELPSVFYA